jgi:hypothetical protein
MKLMEARHLKLVFVTLKERNYTLHCKSLDWQYC